MNVKAQLQVNLPINFYNVCTIYPLSVIDAIQINDEELGAMFMPFALTKDIIVENLHHLSIYEIVLKDFTDLLILSIKFFCKTDNVIYDNIAKEFIIDSNPETLNVTNYDEFSQIILDIGHREKIKKKEEPQMPKFETEDGYKRWKKLQELREKSHPKQDDLELHNVINYVQFAGDFYISDDEIKKWTFWKLMNSYKTISVKQNYYDNFDVFLEFHDNKYLEKHWSEIIKA